MDVLEKHQLIGCLSQAPSWGPGLQPRHVARPRVQPRTLGLQAGAQFTEPHPLQLYAYLEVVYLFPGF